MAIRINTTEKSRIKSLIPNNYGFKIEEGESVKRNTRIKYLRIYILIENDFVCQYYVEKHANGFWFCKNTINNDSISNFNFKNYSLNQVLNDFDAWIKEIKNDIEIPNSLDENSINKMSIYSKRFVKTYFHAETIIKDIDKDCGGMVLRKALEILFVDYFIFKIPTQKGNILTQNGIGGKINKFYKNTTPIEVKASYKDDELQKLQEMIPLIHAISQAKNLGNDFSHYERKLENYSASDFLNIINIIVDYLSKEIDKNIANGKFEKSREGLISIAINK